MEFAKTFFCLGKIRERENQENRGVHLEPGDQPLETNPCSSAFCSPQTCGWSVQLTCSWPNYLENLGSITAFFFHRSDYWDNPACFMLAAPCPTSLFIYLLLSLRGITLKCVVTLQKRIWQLPNSLQHISG